MSTPIDRLQALLGKEAIDVASAQAEKVHADSNQRNIPSSNDQDHGSGGHVSLVPASGTMSDSTKVTHIPKSAIMDKISMIRGEIGPCGNYWPISGASKIPYKFMSPQPELSEIVSKEFFASGIFWANIWTVYYIQVPKEISSKSLLLVPDAEVQSLLSRIKRQYAIHLHPKPESTGIIVKFERDGSPLPRFLGMSTSREEFRTLEASTPTAQLDFQVHPNGTITAGCSQQTFQEWAAKIERAIAATQKNKATEKRSRRKKRLQAKTDWSRQLRRAQRYFGLRIQNPRTGDHIPLHSDILQEGVTAGEDDPLTSMERLGLNGPVCAPFDSNVIFLGIDIEIYERDPKQVTEIGLAVLDTQDLLNVVPGEGGARWVDLVRGRHLWIEEYSHLINHQFVHGCPDRYEEQFGKSEKVTTAEAVQILHACFRNPALARVSGGGMGASPRDGNTVEPSLDSEETGRESMEAKLVDVTETPRKIVVVGHDFNQDIDHLSKIGFNLLGAPNLLEIFDTSELWRTLKREDNPPSVSTMLYHLGICGWHPHNAGNDAAYTVQALIGLVLESITANRKHHIEPEELIVKARLEAEERIKNDLEEWELASCGEEDDGGAPPDPRNRVTLKKKGRRETCDEEC